MPIPTNVSAEEWEVFRAETEEQIEGLDDATLRLEQEETDPELLREMFRLAHTIKGSSASVGLDSMAQLTHSMESLLDRLRSSQIEVTPALVEALFQSCDLLHQLIRVPTEPDSEEPPIGYLLERLELLAEPESAQSFQDPILVGPAGTEPNGGSSTEPAELHEVLVQPTASAVADRPQPAAASQTVRIDVNRLDTLMDLVGELVIDHERIDQITGKWAATARSGVLRAELADVSLHIRRTLDDLRDEVLQSRMVPLSSVLRRLPRVVRDIARDSGKSVELRVRGEDTELDRAVVEELSDPLIHLVRNSVDHGIESPAQRQQQGKSQVGVINIDARPDENGILIELRDDGRGIDIGRVRDVAVARRLLTADTAHRIADDDVLDFIFVPGFSTAESVTAVSGRGVGMDIVRSRIERVNGSISVSTSPGEGTQFVIRLPLTLAIIRGLLVTLRERPYALPLTSVAEVLRIPAEQLRSVGRRPAIDLRGEVLPLIWLDELLAVPPKEPDNRPLTAVSVRVGGRRIGIVVDGLRGEQDIVIKPLGTFIGKARGIAGATILVDGTVCPILNVAGLLAASSLSLSRSEAS